MDNLRSKATHGVVWSAVERYSVHGVQFIIQLVIARLLTPHDYGLIGMLAIFMSLSQVFIDGGFSNALVQKKDRDEDDFSTVFYINLGISLVAYFILFIGAPYIASFYKQPILSPLTRIYSLNLIINSLVAVNKVKLVVALDFKTQSKISLGAAIISGIVGIFCAYSEMGVWALVVQMMLNSILNVILSFYFVKWFPKLLFSISSFKRLFNYGSKLLIASIITSIYSNIYNLVIGKQFAASALGLYTRAQQFSSFVGTNISGVLQRVSFPILSEIQDDNKRLISAYKKYIGISTWATFPVILSLCGVAKPLIVVLLTEKWVTCVPFLQILCFATMWDCVTRVNLNLLYVKGRSDWVLKLEIVKKTIAFSILVTSMFFNMYVICIGQAVYSIIAFYLNTHYTNKLFNYGFYSQMKDLMPQLVLSLIMMGGCLLISELVTIPIISLIVSFLTGITIYWAGSRVFNLYGYQEISQMIKEKLNK